MNYEENAPAELSAASPSDALAIARLHVSSLRAAHRELGDCNQPNGFNVEIRTAQWQHWVVLPERRALVLKQAGELVGFCAAGPARDPDATASTFEIYDLHVAAARGRRGSGTLLLERTISDLVDDAEVLELTLWVLERNSVGRAFCEKLRFVPDGVSKIERVEGTELTAIRYRRKLA